MRPFHEFPSNKIRDYRISWDIYVYNGVWNFRLAEVRSCPCATNNCSHPHLWRSWEKHFFLSSKMSFDDHNVNFLACALKAFSCFMWRQNEEAVRTTLPLGDHNSDMKSQRLGSEVVVVAL